MPFHDIARGKSKTHDLPVSVFHFFARRTLPQNGTKADTPSAMMRDRIDFLAGHLGASYPCGPAEEAGAP